MQMKLYILCPCYLKLQLGPGLLMCILLSNLPWSHKSNLYDWKMGWYSPLIYFNLLINLIFWDPPHVCPYIVVRNIFWYVLSRSRPWDCFYFWDDFTRADQRLVFGLSRFVLKTVFLGHFRSWRSFLSHWAIHINEWLFLFFPFLEKMSFKAFIFAMGERRQLLVRMVSEMMVH